MQVIGIVRENCVVAEIDTGDISHVDVFKHDIVTLNNAVVLEKTSLLTVSA
jgi:hypothetical protein